MTDVLLQTKLFKPAPRPSLIARPHLIEHLNATLGQGTPGLTARLTLVSAPAGFGKTTLIAEWIQDNYELRIKNYEAENAVHNSSLRPFDFAQGAQGRHLLIHNFCWLSLDENDNDPVRFLSYLIAALQTAVPSIGQTAVQLLQSPQPPAAEAILTSVINDISQNDQPIILVLDDYHVIITPAVHQALTFLLDHLPPLFQLLITSRSDPPLPLSRLRARRQMVEIRANDLRFTLDEVRTYFNQVIGLTLSHEETAALEQRTEGWIAGLQLAALSLKGRVDRAELIAAFTGSHRYIIDYLTEEVLSHQSESVRDFLLATSILERVCGPLGDALTQSTSGQATLEYLEHNNLFLTPLDDERRWYRYHHLFAEVLRLRLKQAQPDLLGELHHRASIWHEQNGLLAEAVSHAFKAGEVERAASLIEQTAPAWLETGTISTLRGWLNTLPEAIVRARPQLNLMYAYVLAYTGDPAGFKARLDEIEQMLRAPNPLTDVERNDLLGEVAALQARAASDRNEPLDATELRAILSTVSAGNSRVQGILALAIGHAERLSGNLPEAARFFTRAADLARERGDRLQTVYVMGTLADLQEIQGLLGQAAQTYQQTLQLATSANGKPLPIAATACIGLGKLFYEWNDLEKADHYLRQGMELGKQSGVEIIELYSAIPLALVLQGQGDTSGADAMIQRATQIAKKWNLRPTVIRVAAYEARLWLIRGQWQAAARWAQSNAISDGDELGESSEIEQCTLARLMIVQGKSDEALLLLNRLLPAAERNGWLRHLLEILALQALACQAQGDTAGAVMALERALTLAEPEGFVRVFVDEGEPLRALLHDYRSLLVTRLSTTPDDSSRRLLAYADKLIAAFPTAGNVPAPQLPPYLEPLTERELEVLRLIAAGASNREIAEALVVAVSTVKKHVSNILSKLNATSRTQAVAEARALGFI